MGEMSRKIRVLVVFGFALLLVSRAPAAAQGLTGSIDGTVKDETGAVLPGVTVTHRERRPHIAAHSSG